MVIPRKAEVRFEVEAYELATIDAYCTATGKCRTEVIKSILSDWSDKKLHESSVISTRTKDYPELSEFNRSHGE